MSEPNHGITKGLVDQRVLDELLGKGRAIYDRLLPSLEPKFKNQFVAIHVDSGDYEIGTSATKASRALRERHPPDGRVFLRKIGDEPEYELAARILAGEMRAGATK